MFAIFKSNYMDKIEIFENLGGTTAPIFLDCGSTYGFIVQYIVILSDINNWKEGRCYTIILHGEINSVQLL